jgi:hypothetical protein
MRIGLLLLLCLFWSEAIVIAECRYNLVPSLSVEEKYDDNIFLSSTDETSDWTSNISPSISFDVQCPTRGITLSYQPGFVFYRRYAEYNTVRHNGNLNAFWQAGPYTRIDFRDSFYRTEEPREQSEVIHATRRYFWPGILDGQPVFFYRDRDEIVYATRQTRNPYYRNTGDIKISHQFGPKDSIFVGYNDSHLENRDPEIEDTRIQTPFAGVSYWFDVKNRLELDVRHSISDYETTPDFKEYTGSARFVHLFSQDSSISVAYTHTDMNYDPGRTDYVVHDGKILYSTSLWRYFTLSAGIGYYIYNPEKGDSSDRITYHVDFGREQRIEFERGSFSIGLQSGYRQEVADAENLGFVTFWSANGTIRYFLLSNLTASGGLSYREDRFTQQADRLDTVWSATAGLAYSYRRWLSLSLSGQHTENDSSVDINDYDDNQIMLRISATYN